MKNNNKFRLDVWGAITLATIALYALFLLYPMAYLIRQSVLDPDTGGFTLAYFTKFFSKSYYFDTLINSFKVSITATVLSIAIGTPLAYLFTIFKIKGKIGAEYPHRGGIHVGSLHRCLLMDPAAGSQRCHHHLLQRTSASPSRTSTASAASCWS